MVFFSILLNFDLVPLVPTATLIDVLVSIGYAELISAGVLLFRVGDDFLVFV